MGALTVMAAERLSCGPPPLLIALMRVMRRLPGVMMQLGGRDRHRMRMHPSQCMSRRDAVRHGKRRRDGKKNEFSRANLHTGTHYG